MGKILTGIILLLVGGCAFQALPDTPSTWYDVRWGAVSKQELDNSCGLASLRTVMHYHYGRDIDERTLVRRYLETQPKEVIARAMKEGLSLRELGELAEHVGYETRGWMFSYENLQKLVHIVPVIVYLEVGGFKHFAVVRGVSETEVLLADSSRGNVRYGRDAFLSEWSVPKEFRGRWEHPGGLTIFPRERDDTRGKGLLKTPQAGIPESLRTLRYHLEKR